MPENKEEIPSPFVEPVGFDYEAFQEQTTGKAIEAIFKILGDNATLLTNKSTDTPDMVAEKQSVVAEKMLEALVTYKVPDTDMQYVCDVFQATISMLFRVITRQTTELQKELLARVMEGRNPGDQHFSREYSTIGDLFTALEKKRKEQKDDEHGYFYVKK